MDMDTWQVHDVLFFAEVATMEVRDACVRSRRGFFGSILRAPPVAPSCKRPPERQQRTNVRFAMHQRRQPDHSRRSHSLEACAPDRCGGQSAPRQQ